MCEAVNNKSNNSMVKIWFPAPLCKSAKMLALLQTGVWNHLQRYCAIKLYYLDLEEIRKPSFNERLCNIPP